MSTSPALRNAGRSRMSRMAGIASTLVRRFGTSGNLEGRMMAIPSLVGTVISTRTSDAGTSPLLDTTKPHLAKEPPAELVLGKIVVVACVWPLVERRDGRDVNPPEKRMTHVA